MVVGENEDDVPAPPGCTGWRLGGARECGCATKGTFQKCSATLLIHNLASIVFSGAAFTIAPSSVNAGPGL
jgi:hypothetical protein